MSNQNDHLALAGTFEKMFPSLGRGKFRRTFAISEDRIIKVPLFEDCYPDNLFEAELYSTNRFSFRDGRVWDVVPKSAPLRFRRFVDYFAARGEPLPLAKCDLRWYGDVPVLTMERVTIYWEIPAWQRKDLTKAHPWVCWVDNQQAGLTRDGRFVCYDYNSWSDYSPILSYEHFAR